VGNLDCHAYLYLYGALNLVNGHLTTRLVERPRKTRTAAMSQRRSLPEALATHRWAIARAYPATHYPRVVLVVDNASWHQGHVMDEVLTVFPHLELSPLPSSSPQLQVIERFWKGLRRRATHHRLFQTVTQLKHTLRNNLCYDQTLTHRVLSLIQAQRKRTKLSAA